MDRTLTTRREIAAAESMAETAVAVLIAGSTATDIALGRGGGGDASGDTCVAATIERALVLAAAAAAAGDETEAALLVVVGDDTVDPATPALLLLPTPLPLPPVWPNPPATTPTPGPPGPSSRGLIAIVCCCVTQAAKLDSGHHFVTSWPRQ